MILWNLLDPLLIGLYTKIGIRIKSKLFQIFINNYEYSGKEMFLSNIISDYTKKIVKALNNEGEGVPVFRI